MRDRIGEAEDAARRAGVVASLSLVAGLSALLLAAAAFSLALS